MQAKNRELHFPHALSCALAADVDLPVEEFFFRLDPAVEQLLARGETGQSWAEDADMSGEVLNWKLSSLDFESISPQKGSAVSFDRGNGDVEAQGREKESLALTGFTSNGPEGLLDRKQSDVTRKQQDLKQSQNATNRTSFTKIPRSSNPSIGECR